LKALLHGIGIFLGGKGPDLNMEQLVLWLMTDGYVVASVLQSHDENVSVFLV
jgi:hypothetical protein